MPVIPTIVAARNSGSRYVGRSKSANMQLPDQQCERRPGSQEDSLGTVAMRHSSLHEPEYQ